MVFTPHPCVHSAALQTPPWHAPICAHATAHTASSVQKEPDPALSFAGTSPNITLMSFSLSTHLQVTHLSSRRAGGLGLGISKSTCAK